MKPAYFAINFAFIFSASLPLQAEQIAKGLQQVNPYSITSSTNFLTGYPALNDDGSINAVIEIPTGTTQKWEVDKSNGGLHWEFKKGKPRIVSYLGYPGNYGMIPQTILPKATGGDGDPLDVIVLGPAVPRGTVIHAKLIGVLKLLDDGEQDDKLVAVQADTSLYNIDSIRQLDLTYPGITDIIRTWFTSYKGPGKLTSSGFAEKGEADKVLQDAMAAFKQ